MGLDFSSSPVSTKSIGDGPTLRLLRGTLVCMEQLHTGALTSMFPFRTAHTTFLQTNGEFSVDCSACACWQVNELFWFAQLEVQCSLYCVL
jgi:hypothetical protein